MAASSSIINVINVGEIVHSPDLVPINGPLSK